MPVPKVYRNMKPTPRLAEAPGLGDGEVVIEEPKAKRKPAKKAAAKKSS